MALESFVVSQDFKTPYVRVTGHPRNPQQLKFKTFRKGDIINGELKHANNQPAFVLVEGTLVVPLEVVKKVITKDVVSNADGKAEKEAAKKKPLLSSNPKVQYLDAMIIGGVAGVGAIYLAEKQGWLPVVDKKNKIYGGIAGALLGLYLVYRYKQSKKAEPKTEKE